MSSWTRYWINRDSDGTLSQLVRIRKVEGVGLWGEFFYQDGHWHRSSGGALSYLYDPLLGDEISREEAEQVVRELGHEWPEEFPSPSPGP